MNKNIQRILLSGTLFLGYLYLLWTVFTNPADFPGLMDTLPYLAGIGILLIIVLASSIHEEAKK